MSNQGTLAFSFRTVDDSTFRDPAVVIEVRERGRLIRHARANVPPRPRMEVPAFPQARALVSVVEGRRFRRSAGAPFTLLDGQTLPQAFTFLRKPSAWTAKFQRWRRLGDGFDQLRRVLERSPGLAVRGCRECRPFPFFTGDDYDNIDDGQEKVVLAKAGLLNIFAGFTDERDPVHGRKPWFNFIERILEIDRERIIAVVQDEMAARIKAIKQNIGAFPGYKRAPEQNHWPNVRQYGVTKGSMLSVKTIEKIGNLQLTIGEGKNPSTGRKAWILDADIDENGQWVKHAMDVFKHKFTGGTHPYDIHECLHATRSDLNLGYRLI